MTRAFVGVTDQRSYEFLSRRPATTHFVAPYSRFIAIDWSGAVGGGHNTIWIAEVVDGALTSLENGRSRSQVIDRLIQLSEEDSNFVVGLDFAFSMPVWFMEQNGLDDVGALWELVARDGEAWLRDCEPPFWGRPGRKKPQLTADFRTTELLAGKRAGSQPKSVFQVGGAGAVGTGSLRGMPQLARLREAGFSVWPFDPPTRPTVIEIYPRILTGPVVKSRDDARRAYVDVRFPEVSEEVRQRMSVSEDAFDAAVSTLAMYAHRAELEVLPSFDGHERLEGAIWAPSKPAAVMGQR